MKRLVDTYRLDEMVEVFFQDEEGEGSWRPARVVGRQHPGLWVLTDDRRVWFVTNGKRIRTVSSPHSPDAPLPSPEPHHAQERGEGGP